MLFVLIPAVLMAVVLFGLAVCRLSALSEDSHSVPLGEWIAMSRGAHAADPPERQLPPDQSAEPGAERYSARGRR
ncbi:MAG: hypothetical protein ACLQBB_09080 [Solirubrobacteraceae bacterium]